MNLVKIKNEFSHLYTKTQNGFLFQAIERKDGLMAIYPVQTIKTGKEVTGSQSARHCTVADLEYLETA